MKKYAPAIFLCLVAVLLAVSVPFSPHGEAKTKPSPARPSLRTGGQPVVNHSLAKPALLQTVSRSPNFHLSFPLPNRTAYSALINSVFDHEVPNGWYHPDNKVVAFTGETGEFNPTSPDRKFGNNIGHGDLYAFPNKTVKYPFIVNGNYAGVGMPAYLFYDSHDGIDFKTTDQGNGLIDVLAAADGVLTCGSSALGTVNIDHGNGFKTRYLHLSDRYCGLSQVRRGDPIGKAGGVGADGSIHLHFSVIFNDGVHGDQFVDPYGWHGQYQDPRLGASQVTNTNLWKPHAYTATTITDNRVRWHPDGTLISSVTDTNHTVWLIQGGKRHGIATPEIFRAYGFDPANVINVSPAEVECFPNGELLGMPPSPRLVNAGGTIYEITDQGRKRGFLSPEALQGQGFRWEDVQVGSVAGINDDPNLPVYSSRFRDGALVALLDTSIAGQRRIKPNTPVYVISNSKKRPFVSGNTFLVMGYRFEDVITVTQDVLDTIPDGTAINEGAPFTCRSTLVGSGDTDFFAPTLFVNSPSDGQTVNSSNVTISGTASDLNSGNSGIASVAVNGVRANDDTVDGTGTANWSRAVTLNQGSNLISVVATDGSINQNTTTKTITINYQPPNPTPPPDPAGVTTLATGLSNPNDITTDGAEVFWSDWGSSSVKKVSVSGGAVTTLFGGTFNTSGVALDGSYVYFGHGSELRKVPKVGGASTLLANSQSSITSIAVEGAIVYWTEFASSAVRKMPVNGGAVETLAAGAPSPTGITLGGGSVFWSEFNNPGSIRKVSIGGGGVTVVANGSNTPGVDTDGAHVYWTESNFINAGKVRKIPINGGTETTLASGLDDPYDLVSDGTRVFWVENRTDGAVKQVPAGGGSPVTLASGLSEPVAITAAGDYVYWIERNNGGSGTGTLKRAAKQTAPTATALLNVSPTSLSFGDVELGQSSERIVTITNDRASSGTLNGYVAASPLPFTVVSGGGPFSLSPGQSKQVVVRFAPTSAVLGTYSLDLMINHNGTNQASPSRVSLTGRSVQPSQPGKVWRVVDTIPLSGAEYARHIAISNGRAYVTRSGARMTVVDLNNRTEVGDVVFSAFPGASPLGVAVSGGRAYVALSNLGSNGQMAVVDANTLGVITYISVGTDPHGVAIHNNRAYVTNNVWWTNGDPATVSVIDLNTNSVTATINVGINPRGIAIDPFSGKAFVANGNSLSRSVSVIDTATNAVTKTVAMPADPNEISIVNDRAYVTTGGEAGRVEEISIESGLIVTGVGVGRGPVGVAGGAGYAFAVNQLSNTVSVIDGSSASVVTTLNAGNTATWVAVDQATHAAYVTNQAGRTLSVIRQVSPSFNLLCDPAALTLTSGGSVSSTCSVNSLNGFNSPVDLSCMSLPPGVTCSFSPSSITPPPDGTATSQLTVSAASNAAPGTYSFHVAGTAGGVTMTNSGGLTIDPPPTYSIGGQVTVDGAPLQGVQVALSGAQTNAATTGADGRYSFQGLTAGGSYVATPALSGYSFTPQSRTFNSLGANQVADFVATRVNPALVNVALASNGATAAASSVYDANRLPVGVINGDRKGVQWGTGDPATGSGWTDGTNNAFPDWIEVTFAGTRTIHEVSVFTLQDNHPSPVEPTEALTFTKFGVTAFQVEYWTGSAWAVVPGTAVSGNNKVWRRFAFAPLSTNKIRVLVTDALAGYSRLTEVEAWGEPPRVNHALASNGATASATSVYDSTRLPVGAINGDRKGLQWGTGDPNTGSGWTDGTNNAFPDRLEITFPGPRTVDEIDVFTLQDNHPAPVEPTEALTFSKFGITGFQLEYWDGSAWVLVPGAAVTGNNKVWRKFTFAPLTTTKIRLVVNAALAGYSRVVEVEAWGAGSGAAPPRTNHALALNGATAAASSVYDANRLPVGAINGDRKGVQWGTGDPATGSGWTDGTNNAFPDWVEITFNGTKSLTEVSVFTLQDNHPSPVEPTEALTFTMFGIQDFDVEYWTGSSWAVVPGGSVVGNNKVWRKLTFAPLSTAKIRVTVKRALAGYSRLVEVEAY